MQTDGSWQYTTHCHDWPADIDPLQTNSNKLSFDFFRITTAADESSSSPVINMFEVVLATIETKLQRVENLDRAVHHLMRKMDMMERKLSSKDADVLAAVQALEKQTNEAHVSVKLNQLSAKLDNLCDNNSIEQIEQESPVADSDILEAQASDRKSRVFQGPASASVSMDDVKEVINGIDRRLGVHINIVSENLGKMTHMVEEVRSVLIDTENDEEAAGDESSRKTKRTTKIDQLLTSIHPLLVVSETQIFHLARRPPICIYDMFHTGQG